MPGFEPGDLVKVPFPYTDRPVRQRRPALVLAAGSLAEGHGLLWVLMVTSAEHRPWAEDVLIGDDDAAGLPTPSVIRCAKIATVEGRESEALGRVSPDVVEQVLECVRRILGASAGPTRGKPPID